MINDVDKGGNQVIEKEGENEIEVFYFISDILLLLMYEIIDFFRDQCIFFFFLIERELQREK